MPPRPRYLLSFLYFLACIMEALQNSIRASFLDFEYGNTQTLPASLLRSSFLGFQDCVY